MITIVNYGMGNLGSLQNMLKYIGVEAEVASDPDIIERSEKLLLPGVGAFDTAMRRLAPGTPLREVLDERVLGKGVPILGVCLGMQLLTDGSDEGKLPGLGWIKGWAHRFPRELAFKVPHMGWNTTRSAPESALTKDLVPEPRYYFVHSYYVEVADRSHALMRANHGREFDAAIGRDNIFGVQFHPEKSHRFGMAILQNFANL